MNTPSPRVCDNDRDEITVTLDGKEIRGWSYENEAERRVKMLAAREFCEGWFQATEQSAAPELLAALKAMILNDRHTYRDCHKAALAAIAKAEPVAYPSRQPKKETATHG